MPEDVVHYEASPMLVDFPLSSLVKVLSEIASIVVEVDAEGNCTMVECWQFAEPLVLHK